MRDVEWIYRVKEGDSFEDIKKVIEKFLKLEKIEDTALLVDKFCDIFNQEIMPIDF